MSLEFQTDRVLHHEGIRSDALRRFQAIARSICQGNKKLRLEVIGRLMKVIGDDRILYGALMHIKRRGGAAAGWDGLRAEDLRQSEKWDLVRQLRSRIRSNAYEPDPPLPRQVPKRNGSSERRTIWISSLPDRIVARAANDVLQKLLGSSADPLSFCRPARGPQLALTVVKHLIENYDRCILISEDLRNAFDNVPRRRMFEILESHIPNADVCRLVDVLSSAPGPRGILQGSSLSPMLLNLYLDRTLHRRWRRRHPDVPLVRYVDDCLLLCKEEHDACALYEDFRELCISIGFQPKYGVAKAVAAIRRRSIDWLGYRLKLDAGLLRVEPAHYRGDRVDLGRHRWRDLVGRFEQLHERPHGWQDAPCVAYSVLKYLGPTLPFVDAEAICQLLVDAAGRGGCDLWREDLLRRWHAAYDAWRLRKPPDDVLIDLGEVKTPRIPVRVAAGPKDPPF